MSIDLKPSSATFSTATMQPEAGEYLSAAWARALAQNTGWLSYQGQQYPPMLFILGGDGATGSRSYYHLLGAGTYLVGGHMADQSLSEWYGSLTADGTVIFYDAFQASGSTYVGTIIAATTGWKLFTGSIAVIDSDAATYKITYWIKRYGE